MSFQHKINWKWINWPLSIKWYFFNMKSEQLKCIIQKNLMCFVPMVNCDICELLLKNKIDENETIAWFFWGQIWETDIETWKVRLGPINPERPGLGSCKFDPITAQYQKLSGFSRSQCVNPWFMFRHYIGCLICLTWINR